MTPKKRLDLDLFWQVYYLIYLALCFYPLLSWEDFENADIRSDFRFFWYQ